MLCRYSELFFKKGCAMKMNKQRLSYSGRLRPWSICKLSWFLGTEEKKTTWRKPLKWCRRRDLSRGHICLIFECSLPCATLANVGTCALTGKTPVKPVVKMCQPRPSIQIKQKIHYFATLFGTLDLTS